MAVHFWCIFFAWLSVYLCKIPVALAMHRAGGYDNHDPRGQQAILSGWGKRALAAHQNGFEVFAPFAAAVLVAHLGGAATATVDLLAVVFVVSRLLYIASYLADLATLRSAVWTVGSLATLGLFIVSVV